jgi:hypothetical protein
MGTELLGEKTVFFLRKVAYSSCGIPSNPFVRQTLVI